jgi:DNA-binding transcriptional ArsR family regulator
MKDGPNIVAIAALIGDNARADVLTALMADRALTATELAALAGVTKQTISAHLAKLVDAGLIGFVSQGRHRYFRLANEDVAHLLESLMGVAFRTGAVRVRASPREPALRAARVCYDHLAGAVGVDIYERLLQRRALVAGARGLEVTAAGAVAPEARLLSRLPRLERATPSSRRCARRGAPVARRRAGLGEAGARLARRVADSRGAPGLARTDLTPAARSNECNAER